MKVPTKITKKVKSCHTQHYDKPAQQINAVSLLHAERQNAAQEHSPRTSYRIGRFVLFLQENQAEPDTTESAINTVSGK